MTGIDAPVVDPNDLPVEDDALSQSGPSGDASEEAQTPVIPHVATDDEVAPPTEVS